MGWKSAYFSALHMHFKEALSFHFVK
jgi:hypothetical protein